MENELVENIKACFRQCNALRKGNEKLGPWMSAALEDPNVCEEMKADIRAWFEAQETK
jgi:hypothetical protein